MSNMVLFAVIDNRDLNNGLPILSLHATLLSLSMTPRISAIFICLFILIVLPVRVSAEFSPSDTLSIVVRESKLRVAGSHWAAPRADLKYGDTVTVVSAGENWIEVTSSSGAQGFVHASAVTSRRVVLKAGATPLDTKVEATDVVLAGKGFNEDVEDLYKTQESALDFAFIDRWEKERPSDETLRAFMVEGGLVQ